MLKSLVKALGFTLYERKRSIGLIAGLAFSGAAFALGMGGINVVTGLGEPLKADIELVAVSKAEKGSLSARLASPEVFKSAGMEYPSGLPKLQFKIETRANGEPYLSVTTSEPVNEPFVSMLVELSWPSGKLLREYTFLLDPPGFKPDVAKEPEVKPVAPSAAAAPEAKPAAPAAVAAPAEEIKKPVARGLAEGTVKVNRGDTLAKIAEKTKPADISLERMLVALYRANADVFDGKNMNRLKAGKILRMPEQSEVDSLSQADSVKEIHVQAADWHAYRQKLAAATVAVPEQAPKQEVSGKISTTVVEKAPAAKESAKEVIRLSKGEAPGDKTAGVGGAKTAQEKAKQQEEAIAKGKELKESSERIAMLEKNAKAMQRLIELKSQAAAKPEVKAEAKPEPQKAPAKPAAPAPAAGSAAAPTSAAPASAVAPASGVAAASAVAPASAVQPTKPKRVAKPKPVASPPPPPSLVDEILGEPLYLAGGAAALLALGGLGLALARRRKAGEAAGGAPIEKAVVSGGGIHAPAAPSPETGDFTGAATSAVAAVTPPEEVNPISEADLFLNFGRDAQAEEILKDALGRSPSNLPVMLKLMSIYANRKDVGSFSAYAHQVKDSGDAAAWEQAAEMGRKLEPENPLYGGEGGEPEIYAAPEAAKSRQPAPVVDFDLGLGAPEVAPAVAADEKTVAPPPVDFDLGFEEPTTPPSETTMVMPPAELEKVEAGAGETEAVQEKPEQEEQGGAQAVSLDFDVTATNPSLPAAEAEHEEVAAPAAEGAGGEGAFVLDFSIEEQPAGEKTEAVPAQAEAGKTIDIDLSGISLDIGEPSAPAAAAPAPEARDANWHDVATKLDLAKAYQEMGDAAGAREILEEVMREGDAQQRETAESILKQLPA